ncbi:FAD-binding oxidoreductase [Eubacterium sp.]|uniref:FAD-binding oxidoreductase n=1 Tax=Eubacterium sp. TaxID=142586 RepID=UPI0025D84326|nr:FAD-binding oxidoreductase [Eubacterium sp.]MCR5630270.1 2Fe-2S iron-sulfur cluster binding domain-containing protein [Eubacterium sp.]
MENKYLNDAPDVEVKDIVSKRQKVISEAADSMPKYEYNANVLAKNLHPKVQHVKITDIEDLADAKIYTLCANPDLGTKKLAYFRAGQYVSLFLKIDGSVLTRPYSICSSPREAFEGKYRILVKTKADGFASKYINEELKVGDSLEISGPEGFFYYEGLRDAEFVYGLVGGSGISPFVSMAEAICDGTEDFNLTIIYGSRISENILLKEKLDELSKRSNGKVKVFYVLSDEEKDGFEHGFITADIIRKYQNDTNNADEKYSVFVCGSQAMYDYLDGELIKLNIAKKYIRYDAYGEYELGERDSEFVNEFKESIYKLTVVTNDGKERVIDAKATESLLVAMERVGIKAPSKCRSGECGFCRSKLVLGDVFIPEKVEKRRQYDKLTGYIHPCCTYPKSDCRILVNCEEPRVERKVKDMKKKERTMGLVMSIIMSAAMGALSAYLVMKGNPKATKSVPVPMMYISNILLSVTVGIIVALCLPFGKMGRALAQKAHAKPPAMKFTLLNAIPFSVGNTLIVSFVVSFFGVAMGRSKAPASAVADMPPLPIMWLGSWGKILIPTLILSYVLSVLLSPFVSQLVGLTDAGAEVGRASRGED